MMSTKEILDGLRQGWAAVVALAALIGALTAFAGLPARATELERRVELNDRRISRLERQAPLLEFLGCSEAARQLRREDPSCLRNYLSQVEP